MCLGTHAVISRYPHGRSTFILISSTVFIFLTVSHLSLHVFTSSVQECVLIPTPTTAAAGELPSMSFLSLCLSWSLKAARADHYSSYFIWTNTMEACWNRFLSSYSPDIWSIDMCKNMVVECKGISNYYCNDCSEDHTLEFQLDE